MRVLSFRFLFLAILAVSQAAQGMLAGTTLCREETGSVVLEWARDGQCDAPGVRAMSLLEDNATLEHSHPAEEHCGTCLDLPLPSETSLKSLSVSSHALVALSVCEEAVLFVPSQALPAPASASGSLVTGPLGSVRLLI
jgi:hypothetical protein